MLHALSTDAEPERQAPADGPSDDAMLVTAAQADPRAFAPLYARYARPVYRYCSLRLDSHAAAEDATSDVFLKALAALPRYRDGAFAAWLFQIAHNVVQDIHRRRRPTEQIEAVAEACDPDPTPEDAALGQAGWEDLRATLDRLPASQRRAIELHIAGWSVAQSAAILGMSPGSVKVLRHRGFTRLRTLLSQSV